MLVIITVHCQLKMWYLALVCFLSSLVKCVVLFVND